MKLDYGLFCQSFEKLEAEMRVEVFENDRNMWEAHFVDRAGHQYGKTKGGALGALARHYGYSESNFEVVTRSDISEWMNERKGNGDGTP